MKSTQVLPRSARGPAFMALAAALALSCSGMGDDPGSASQALLTPPADNEFVAFTCGDDPASDGKGGTGGPDTDLVGDSTHPVLLRALDADFLYIRMRLDGTPVSGAGLTPKNWGVLIDSDGDATSFEYLLNVNGNASTITWEFNDVQDPPDDPGDGVRSVVATYTPWDDFYHVKETGDGSSFSNDADFFLTVAIRRSDLDAAAISLTDPISIWAATSTNNLNFTADLSCANGGNPPLGGNETDLDPLDPACLIDSDGDGECDVIDVCPLDNPNDSDGDGQCDSDDPCPADNPDDTDGDGQCDSDDPCPFDNPDDTDGDGVCDSDDLCLGDDAAGDSDGDGVCDDQDV
ncbi:MAG: MSCRAMM family adhesin SdrC, partial [Deltaproteobacteria bacterium]|nr:MSCRAMM family adhesin SdrC [Deltaproteobacteria bacterium]